MLLFRLRLVHYRGVDDRTVEFAAPGVTVVAGPNETGKSSLLEALDLLFRYADDSKSLRLREIQPVGRDVPTTVEAELSLGPERVRYRKTWFTDRGTSLTIGSTSLTGRVAHDRAREIFESYVDSELWQALVVSQAQSLEQPQPQRVPSVLNALSVGRAPTGDGSVSPPARVVPGSPWRTAPQVADDEGMTLAARVEREYTRYFTIGRGDVTGELAQLMRVRDHAATELQHADEQLCAVADQIARAEELATERARLHRERAQAEKRLATLTQELAVAGEAERHRLLLVQVAEGAAEAARAARDRARFRDRLIAEIAALDDALATCRDDAESTGILLAEADAAVAAAESTLSAAAVEAAEAGDWLERQKSLAQLHRDRAELDEVTGRLDAAREAAQAQREAETELAGAGPTRATAEAGERLAADLEVAESAAEAQSARLTLRRLGKHEVHVCDGSADIDLEVGQTVDLPVLQPAVVTVDGILEVSVEPARELEARGRALRLRAELDELLRSEGFDDVATLREAAARRVATEQALASARQVGEGVLAGLTIDELSARQTRLLDQIERAIARVEAAGGHPADAAGVMGTPLETGPSPQVSQISLFDDEPSAKPIEPPGDLDDAKARERLAEAALSQAKAYRRDLATELRLTEQRLEQAGRQRDKARADLDEERSESGDDDVLADADRTRRAAVAAQTAVDEASSAVDLHDLTVREAAAAAELRRLQHGLGQAEAEWHRALGRLDDAGARGVGTGRDAVAAVFDQADEQYQQVLRKAEAARLLRQTLDEHRAAARRDYAAPLRDRIAELGRRIFGPDFGVVLSGDLEVVARTVGGVTLPATQLSTGATEQLAIVVRLAIAALTSRDGQGVPVVLDDALGWSDAERLARMGDLLAEAGQHSQVILLTSQPSRYTAIPGVNLVTVASGRASLTSVAGR